MNNREAKEILDHNWTKLVNPDYSDEELGEAQNLAIKALEQTDKDKVFAFLDGAGQGILAGLKIHKGKWIDTEPDKDKWHKSNNPWKCSCCGHRAGKDKYKTYKFCPWCGADMKGNDTE